MKDRLLKCIAFYLLKYLLLSFNRKGVIFWRRHHFVGSLNDAFAHGCKAAKGSGDRARADEERERQEREGEKRGNE